MKRTHVKVVISAVFGGLLLGVLLFIRTTEDLQSSLAIELSTLSYSSETKSASSTSTFASLLQTYVQYDTSERFRKNVVSRIRKDQLYSWLLEVLTRVRLRLVTQTELHHFPPIIPDFVLGMGWCDQVNAIAARIVAPYFQAAEIYALRNAYGQSPHTIARVLDVSSNEWIYFDIWGNRVVIFTKKFGAPLRLIANRRLIYPTVSGQTLEDFLRLYEDTVDRGFTLSEIQSTFFQQVSAKFYRRFVSADSKEMIQPAKIHYDRFVSRASPQDLGFDDEYLDVNSILLNKEFRTRYFAARMLIIDGRLREGYRAISELLASIEKSNKGYDATEALLRLTLNRLQLLMEVPLQ